MTQEKTAPMVEAMKELAQEDRREPAFWRRLEKMNSGAASTIRRIMALQDTGERIRLIEEFNEGKKIGRPYTKDGIMCDDGFYVKVGYDNNGNVMLGYSRE